MQLYVRNYESYSKYNQINVIFNLKTVFTSSNKTFSKQTKDSKKKFNTYKIKIW